MPKKRTSVAVRCAPIAVSLIMSTTKKGHIALCLCTRLFYKTRESSGSTVKRIFWVKYCCITLCVESLRRARIMQCISGAKSHAMSMMNVMNNLLISRSGIKYFFICSQIGVTIFRSGITTFSSS